MKRPPSRAEQLVSGWLAEERARHERTDRRVARRMAEREHFGPKGRPKALPSDPSATENEEGDPSA